MSAEIVSLDLKEIGDNAIIEADRILEGAKCQFQRVVIIGFNQDGEIEVRSSHGSREALWLIERGKHHLLIETG